MKSFKEKNYVGLLEEFIQGKLWIKKVIEKVIRLFNLCFNGIGWMAVSFEVGITSADKAF